MIFTAGLGVPEGPVLLPDGNFLVVEMAPDRGCVSEISADGTTIKMVAQTGRPNGLAVDATGNVWVAESLEPSLVLLRRDGAVLSTVSGMAAEPFLFPNDLAFGPDGLLYFTDSGVLIGEFAPEGTVRPDWRSVRSDGRCYRMNPATLEVERLAGGLRFPNGIAFSRDGDLFINETLTGDVIRFSRESGYRKGAVFGNVLATREFEKICGPDGMKFGADGSLFVAVFGQGDVTVLSPRGDVVRRIETAAGAPTNLCFGPAGTGTIYVTEDDAGTLERHDAGCDGLPLHYGAPQARVSEAGKQP